MIKCEQCQFWVKKNKREVDPVGEKQFKGRCIIMPPGATGVLVAMPGQPQLQGGVLQQGPPVAQIVGATVWPETWAQEGCAQGRSREEWEESLKERVADEE